MTDFEKNMEALLNNLDLAQVTSLAEAAKRRQSELEQEQVDEVFTNFVAAYKKLRKVAPNMRQWLCWEYENCHGILEEQDFDVFEMLDALFERELLIN